jgi:hypothetical protein
MENLNKLKNFKNIIITNQDNEHTHYTIIHNGDTYELYHFPNSESILTTPGYTSYTGSISELIQLIPNL